MRSAIKLPSRDLTNSVYSKCATGTSLGVAQPRLNLRVVSRADFHDLVATPLVQEHRAEVQRISERVNYFHQRAEKFRIFHGSTNSTRKSATDRDPQKVVDTSNLNHVLHVDRRRRTATVQPNVPMDRLVEATLAHGLVPLVVPEFPGITVGGGYSGTTGESSSFRHGFFDQTLNRIEMVLATGETVVCSETERPDLFRGAAGALGTFGVTTLAEIQLREAAKFVETTYHAVVDINEAIEIMQQFTSEETNAADFVDGIMYSQHQGAVILGRFTDSPPAGDSIRRFSSPWDPWYYLHVQNFLESGHATMKESIPLPEYLFRYDRGGFWVGRIPFKYFKNLVPFNRVSRWCLDDFLHTRMLYKALHGSGQDQNLIVQDLALPYETIPDFINWTHDRFGIWPLWLCPLKQSSKPTMHPHLVESEANMLNVGLWGMLRPGEDAVKANRDLESKLAELGGMKWLYAQTYYSEDEFWHHFDRQRYDGLREKYHATNLPSVYDKVKVGRQISKDASLWEKISNSWPYAGFYGLRKAIQSRAYLLSRKSTWPSWVPR